MLFSEVYGSYFNVVAAVLRDACTGTLTQARMDTIIREMAFGESILKIQPALKTNEWPLITSELKTPVKRPPTMPLTTLQKRWLKALLSDPRIKLFDVTDAGLEDVEPLYEQCVFEYFDRYSDGDPFGDDAYIGYFRTILDAIKTKTVLKIHFTGRNGETNRRECTPYKLEYSSKDDKFRLLAIGKRFPMTINLARIVRIDVLEALENPPHVHRDTRASIVMELTDERNALERAMLHFSHLEKETVRLDDTHYKITMRFDKEDETELLIRVLSFGPKLRVLQPESFISQLRERIEKQKACGLK